jgi:release factor glutamine methyltransferase
MEIYEPREDSYLLTEVLEEYLINREKSIKILDIGTGCGIQAKTCKKQGFNNVLLSDINKVAIGILKKQGFNAIESDLFENINKKFDLIVFNPPYLPLDKREPISSRVYTTGGKYGSEVINHFLKDAKNSLNKNGEILLITSSLTKNIDWQDYKKSLIKKEKFFFEEIYCWKLSR